MPDYIDREKVKDEILSWAVCINNPNMLSRDDTLYCIDTISAADVAPVRHGRWIDGEKNPVPWDEYNPNCPLYSAYCSECGKWLVGSDEYPASGLYCPNCGCLMLGGDRDDKFCSYGQRKEG